MDKFVLELLLIRHKKESDLRKRQRGILNLRKKHRLWETYNQAMDSILQWVVIAALYGIGGYFICKESLTIGSLTAFLSYSNYVIGPIAIVFNLKFIFAQIKPSIDRLRDFFGEESESVSVAEIEITQFQSGISFDKVDFSYSKGALLKEVSFKIRKGEKIAIIGDNGSGKSTLISMLLRFLTPQEGMISVDGINITEYNLNQYRDLFSVVSQDIYLFKDTLRNNITMGKTIEEGELEKVCRKMKLQETIERFPKGYENMLEGNGENISGGERQKIALLRAVIRDAPILIMDEATANIDKKYDEFLHQNLLKEFPDKTIIMITHRKENLKGMDKIYQIYNNSIREYTYLE